MPVVTMAGVQVGGLLGGSVVVESVFAWPGLGQLAFQSLVRPRSQSAAWDLLHFVVFGRAGEYCRGRRVRAPRPASQGRLMQGFWRRFIGNPRVALSLIWLAFIVTVAAAAPLLAPGSPFVIVSKPFSPPFGEFLLGTDSLGRSLLAGLIHGARTSLLIGNHRNTRGSRFRHADRVPRWLLRRHHRRRAHARKRILPNHSIIHFRHRASCDSGSFGREPCHRHRYSKLAADRSSSARRGPDHQGARVCAGRDRRWPARHGDPGEPGAAQRSLAAHRHRLAAGRQCDPDRVGTFVPGAWCAEPDELGFPDRSWPRLPEGCLVAGDVPGVAILLTVLAINLVGEGLNDALNPRLRDI